MIRNDGDMDLAFGIIEQFDSLIFIFVSSSLPGYLKLGLSWVFFKISGMFHTALLYILSSVVCLFVNG